MNLTNEVNLICELSHTINYKSSRLSDGFAQFDINHLTLSLLRSLPAISMLLVDGLPLFYISFLIIILAPIFSFLHLIIFFLFRYLLDGFEQQFNRIYYIFFRVLHHMAERYVCNRPLYPSQAYLFPSSPF